MIIIIITVFNLYLMFIFYFITYYYNIPTGIITRRNTYKVNIYTMKTLFFIQKIVHVIIIFHHTHTKFKQPNE